MSENPSPPAKSLLGMPEPDHQHFTTPTRGRSFKVKDGSKQDEKLSVDNSNSLTDRNIEILNTKLRKISDDRERADTVDEIVSIRVDVCEDENKTM